MAKRRGPGRAPGPRRASRATPKPLSRPRAEPRGEQLTPSAAPSSFRLGAVPGATVGKWIDTWNQRMPQVPLALEALAFATQTAALHAGEIDMAVVRLPLDRAGLHVIRLYDESPVVVASADSHLLVADELTAEDLADEVLIVPDDNVLGELHLPRTRTPDFPPLRHTGEAIATAATGAGVVVVPMSLARLHHRKDADYRPLLDGPVSAVALAWRQEDDNPHIQTFIGIVRGRTVNSSR